jgi:hypothetical protein
LCYFLSTDIDFNQINQTKPAHYKSTRFGHFWFIIKYRSELEVTSYFNFYNSYLCVCVCNLCVFFPSSDGKLKVFIERMYLYKVRFF